MELKRFVAQDIQGNVVPNPQATLYIKNTTTLATGLQDASGAALTNPWVGSVLGEVYVAAPDGEYDLLLSGDGKTSTLVAEFLDEIAAHHEDAAAHASVFDQHKQSVTHQFGAKGDGTDDQAAFDSAEDAASDLWVGGGDI